MACTGLSQGNARSAFENYTCSLGGCKPINEMNVIIMLDIINILKRPPSIGKLTQDAIFKNPLYIPEVCDFLTLHNKCMFIFDTTLGCFIWLYHGV